MPINQTLSKNAYSLLEVLRKGTIRQDVEAGDVLIECNNNFIHMNRTELYYAVRELQKNGYTIERIDAGGAPEWELKI